MRVLLFSALRPGSTPSMQPAVYAGIQIMKRMTSNFKPFTPDEEEVYELKQTQSSSRHVMVADDSFPY